MYTKITDPSTGKLHLIHSVKGKEIIQGYLSHLKGGSNKILEKLHKQLKKAQQKVDLIKNKINKLQIGGSGATLPAPPAAPTTPIDLTLRTGKPLSPAVKARQLELRRVLNDNRYHGGRRLTAGEAEELEVANYNEAHTRAQLMEYENNPLPPDFNP